MLEWTCMSSSRFTEAKGVPLVSADITAGKRVLCSESNGDQYLMVARHPKLAPNPWLSFHPAVDGTPLEPIFKHRCPIRLRTLYPRPYFTPQPFPLFPIL